MGNATPSAADTTALSKWRYHILALVTVLIWSTTFVSTKVLLSAGLSPEYIFFYRFLMAYTIMIFFARGRLFADSIKDELMMFLAGVTGGSFYFWTENTALQYTYASNASILISGTPVLTIFLVALFFHQKINPVMLGGSLLALAGVATVVISGSEDLRISPLGDFLIFLASASWAFYSVILKYLDRCGYSTMFITRKVFFYGMMTMAIFLPFSNETPGLELLTIPEVCGNLLFLGIIASFACFAAWNKVLDEIGTDKASNYMYINPLGTVVTAAAVLGETVSTMAFAGAVITLTGVAIAVKSRK